MSILKRYMSRIADQGCILCHHLGYGQTPAQLHHPREGAGMGQRGDDWNAIPLCIEHHTGPSGFHGMGKRAFEMRYDLDELDLLAMTRKRDESRN